MERRASNSTTFDLTSEEESEICLAIHSMIFGGQQEPPTPPRHPAANAEGDYVINIQESQDFLKHPPDPPLPYIGHHGVTPFTHKWVNYIHPQQYQHHHQHQERPSQESFSCQVDLLPPPPVITNVPLESRSTSTSEIHFIVGPSPNDNATKALPPSSSESQVQNYHQKKKRMWDRTQKTREQHHAQEQVSARKEQKPPETILEEDYHGYYSSEEEEEGPMTCGAELAEPSESSHTIIIKNPDHSKGLPCISSEEDDEMEAANGENGDGDANHSRPPFMNQEHGTLSEESNSSSSNNSVMVDFGKKAPLKPPQKGQKPQLKKPVVKNSNKEKRNVETSAWDSHSQPAEDAPGFMRDRRAEMREQESIEDKTIPEALLLIDDISSWERNVCGLKVISMLVQQEEQHVLERLPAIVQAIQKHIRASGSKLARQAILTLRDLFAVLGPHFDLYLHPLSERLFSKMANTNRFIKDDCEATLEAMVIHCSQPKMIQIIETIARRHKHAQIRLVATRMMTKFIKLVGPDTALHEYADMILPILLMNLAERSQEIRDEARSALKMLISLPSFDSYMRQYVSPQFIFSICDKLQRIRDEVSDKPKINRRVSKNQSMFKWKQKFNSNSQL